MAAQLNSGTTVEVPSPPRVQRSPGLAPHTEQVSADVKATYPG
jgi:hypothetical protein